MTIPDEGVRAGQVPRRMVAVVPHTHWDREWYEGCRDLRRSSRITPDLLFHHSSLLNGSQGFSTC